MLSTTQCMLVLVLSLSCLDLYEADKIDWDAKVKTEKYRNYEYGDYHSPEVEDKRRFDMWQHVIGNRTSPGNFFAKYWQQRVLHIPWLTPIPEEFDESMIDIPDYDTQHPTHTEKGDTNDDEIPGNNAPRGPPPSPPQHMSEEEARAYAESMNENFHRQLEVDRAELIEILKNKRPKAIARRNKEKKWKRKPENQEISSELFGLDLDSDAGREVMDLILNTSPSAYHDDFRRMSDRDVRCVRRMMDEDGEYWSVSPPLERITANNVHRQFRKGFSLVMNLLSNRWAPATRVADDFMALLFGFRTNINLYLTPHNSQAFEAHFDWMESFIFQLNGRKHWTLWDPLVWTPRADMKFKPTQAQIDAKEPTLITLEPGDILYLPAGVIHEATTVPLPTEKKPKPETDAENKDKSTTTTQEEEDEEIDTFPSLHLTVGVEIDPFFTHTGLLIQTLQLAYQNYRAFELTLDETLPWCTCVSEKMEPPTLRWLDILHLSILEVASRPENYMLRRALNVLSWPHLWYDETIDEKIRAKELLGIDFVPDNSPQNLLEGRGWVEAIMQTRYEYSLQLLGDVASFTSVSNFTRNELKRRYEKQHQPPPDPTKKGKKYKNRMKDEGRLEFSDSSIKPYVEAAWTSPHLAALYPFVVGVAHVEDEASYDALDSCHKCVHDLYLPYTFQTLMSRFIHIGLNRTDPNAHDAPMPQREIDPDILELHRQLDEEEARERAEREAKDAERIKDEKPRQVHITEDGRVLPVLEDTYDEDDPHRGEEQLDIRDLPAGGQWTEGYDIFGSAIAFIRTTALQSRDAHHEELLLFMKENTERQKYVLDRMVEMAEEEDRKNEEKARQEAAARGESPSSSSTSKSASKSSSSSSSASPSKPSSSSTPSSPSTSTSKPSSTSSSSSSSPPSRSDTRSRPQRRDEL